MNKIIKLRNVLVSLEKNKTNGPKFARFQSIRLSDVWRDGGMLSEIHVKTVQHCRAEDCLAINMEWFANPVISKETLIVCCCSWQTFWTLSLNTERAGSWQSLIHYYWTFKSRLHVHLEKWTLKFKLLYLLNHMCYYNKICRICGLNPYL